jgi:hypothetical protein
MIGAKLAVMPFRKPDRNGQTLIVFACEIFNSLRQQAEARSGQEHNFERVQTTSVLAPIAEMSLRRTKGASGRTHPQQIFFS